jgi:hypothetical protein
MSGRYATGRERWSLWDCHAGNTPLNSGIKLSSPGLSMRLITLFVTAWRSLFGDCDLITDSGVSMILKRTYLDNCTIGKLYDGAKFICYTIERPWLSNQANISCIPPGEYSVKPYSSGKYENVFVLENYQLGVSIAANTPRTHILIHAGNFPEDIKGCIAPGLSLHPERWGVADSRSAMNLIRELAPVSLTILV